MALASPDGGSACCMMLDSTTELGLQVKAANREASWEITSVSYYLLANVGEQFGCINTLA